MADVSHSLGLVEVRVTTHKRPDLLRRALRSLVAQTFSDWHAVVLDDDLGRSAEAVVQEVADPRIHYHPNEKNLGCTQNINQAFRPMPFLGGEFACILEDDNVWFPDFLQRADAAFSRHGVALVLLNGEFWKQEGDAYSRIGAQTLAYEPGLVQPLTIHAHTIINTGLGNAGLVWKMGCQSVLDTKDWVQSSTASERLRGLGIVEPVWFEKTPAFAFTIFPDRLDSTQTDGVRRRGVRENRSITAAAIRFGGASLAQECTRAEDSLKLWGRFAERMFEAKPIASLLFEGAFPKQKISLVQWVKMAALNCVYPDPLAGWHPPR